MATYSKKEVIELLYSHPSQDVRTAAFHALYSMDKRRAGHIYADHYMGKLVAAVNEYLTVAPAA